MIRIVVLTDPGEVENEYEIINGLFSAGLYRLHVRKPEFSYRQMEDFVKAIPKKYRRRLVLHSHHFLTLKYGLGGVHLTDKMRRLAMYTWLKVRLTRLILGRLTVSASFHKLSDLEKDNHTYSYVFLSPIFESISKKNYKPNYNLVTLFENLPNIDHKVLALGGVDESKINLCIETGFKGAGLLGSIWGAENPLEEYKKTIDRCKSDQEMF